MPNPSLLKNSSDTGLGNTFPNGFIPEVNVLARLELELVYFEAGVQHFSHYSTGIPPSIDFKYS